MCIRDRVVMAAVSGDPTTLGIDLTASAMWFFLGQLCFCLYAYVIRTVNAWDFLLEVKAGNPAAAILFGLQNVTIGSIVSNSISKSDSLLAFVVWFLFGGVAVYLLQIAIDKIVFPNQTLAHEVKADRNWGAALVCGAIPLGVSFVLNTFLPSTCDNTT